MSHYTLMLWRVSPVFLFLVVFLTLSQHLVEPHFPSSTEGIRAVRSLASSIFIIYIAIEGLAGGLVLPLYVKNRNEKGETS